MKILKNNKKKNIQGENIIDDKIIEIDPKIFNKKNLQNKRNKKRADIIKNLDFTLKNKLVKIDLS
jgi:hypothetical protein